MLAGRKLLLADDSITIQKIVDVTFADEGVSVVCVNNGWEAIERLEEFAPDIVLADVFMPQVNGYELCEYIKQEEKLRHIPVMLLVGSFEPFDEAEARRVGADDTMTKPFESIRRLLDKVGLLTSARPPEEQIPTAELPKAETAPEPEPEKLSEAEIAITTADTLPLPAELSHIVEGYSLTRGSNQRTEPVTNLKVDEGTMESKGREVPSQVSEEYESAGDVLLDLGDFEPTPSGPGEEFVLDIDLDEVPEPSPVTGSPWVPAAPVVSRPGFYADGGNQKTAQNNFAQSEFRSPATAWSDSSSFGVDTPRPTENPFVTTQDLSGKVVPSFGDALGESAPEISPEAGRGAEQPQQRGTNAIGSQQISLEQLSPEVIDAIARRAVEQLSEKVVQQIAWEVVPQLAELLIKRQLEEKNS